MKILIILLIGMVIGYFASLNEKQKAINGKLQQLGVVVLLFFMGASIGANEEVIKNLGAIGVKSFVFAILACVCSVIVVYFLSKKFLMPKKNKVEVIEEEVELINKQERSI